MRGNTIEVPLVESEGCHGDSGRLPLRAWSLKAGDVINGLQRALGVHVLSKGSPARAAADAGNTNATMASAMSWRSSGRLLADAENPFR